MGQVWAKDERFKMTANEIEVIGGALAAHPPVIIGALLLFQCIKRSKYFAHLKATQSANQ